MLREKCRRLSSKGERPIDKEVFVVDFKGTPFFIAWACLKSTQEVMTIDEQYYPDTIAHLLIINAPSYFPTLFAIIKPWMNPLDVEKIEIYGEKDYYPGLLKYIDESVIPVEYGGKNESFSWAPPNNINLDEHPTIVDGSELTESRVEQKEDSL
jgi:hypothetical protein